MRRTVFGLLMLLVTVAPLLAGLGLLGRKLVGARPTPIDLSEIRQLVEAHREQDAQARLESYLAASPGAESATFALTRLLLDRPKPLADRALDYLHQVRPTTRATAALVKFFEGRAHYHRRRFDLAEACWEEALRLDPAVPEAGWALMELLDVEGRGDDAHRLGMRLHEVEPDPRDRVRLLLDLSRMELEKVAPGSQVQMFEPMVRQSIHDLPIDLAYGLGLVRDSRSDEGLEVLGQALKRYPEDARAWDAWLTGLDDSGRHDRIGPEFARLPKTIATDPRFAKHAGRAAQEARDWKTAAQAYHRAWEFQPYDGVILYRLHRALRFADETAEAEHIGQVLAEFQAAFKRLGPAYEEAAKLRTLGTEPHVELYQRLAQTREQMGRPDEARAWHRLALRDRPGDALSLAALARLK